MTSAYKVGTGMGLTIGILLFWLLLIPLATLMGGVAGTVVGFFFGTTLLPVFGLIGLKGVTMWQIGCFFGFVGSFFRANVSKTGD